METIEEQCPALRVFTEYVCSSLGMMKHLCSFEGEKGRKGMNLGPFLQSQISLSDFHTNSFTALDKVTGLDDTMLLSLYRAPLPFFEINVYILGEGRHNFVVVLSI